MKPLPLSALLLRSPYEMAMGVSFILLLVLFKQLAARNK